ncbi:MAG: DUF2161 family putative PD-(D/E)XK-type phosphodiesterase [Defluviitaleaceae bacterium]|nr:DUF2161 family putative PD-(D/E)XK-type phosphodiesterase [Defluviitaleaceae bacterium]MCL2263743.1 DUF2161 family putative PD-(D/E)XK-type phosphodiesterase [Defluviitaleaceae bacterium]
MTTKPKESDLYEPIKTLLLSQGFIVRGEVKGCDIAAVQGDTLWVVEMKLSANITLIYQAMERQAAASGVFVAIPRPKNARDSNFRAFQKLLKKLELGLITVALDSPTKHAEILIFPNEKSRANKKSVAIKKEIFGRTTDTTGGISKEKINTAYRERCVKIATLLETKGAQTAKALVSFGCEKDTNTILRANYFGWFEKIAPATYNITESARNYLTENASSPLITYYRLKSAEIL